MNGWKVLALGLVAVAAIYILLNILSFLASILIPIAIVAAIGYVLYQLVARKPIGGRTFNIR